MTAVSPDESPATHATNNETQPMKLEGKTVWITGASSGIGEAVTREALRRGANVVISARRESLLDEIRDESGAADRVFVLPLDVTDTEAHAEKTSLAWAAFDGVDVMVHNAGISQRSLVEETVLAVDRRVMEVNFFGTISLTHHLLPLMKARGTGSFAVVSSVAGYVGTALRSSYAASKHALQGYFNSLRAEIHDDGLRVTLFCPGYVDTEITMNAVTGSGEKFGVAAEAQKNGVSAEKAASKLLDAVQRGVPEAYVGGKELAGIYIQRLSPSLASRLVRILPTS